MGPITRWGVQEVKRLWLGFKTVQKHVGLIEELGNEHGLFGQDQVVLIWSWGEISGGAGSIIRPGSKGAC